MAKKEEIQRLLDEFYLKNGKCCAGCDWWRWHGATLGECVKNAPVSGKERYGLLGISSLSIGVEAGHILTKRNHVCGDFADKSVGSNKKLTGRST